MVGQSVGKVDEMHKTAVMSPASKLASKLGSKLASKLASKLGSSRSYRHDRLDVVYTNEVLRTDKY